MNAFRDIKLIPDGDGQTIHIPSEFKLPAEDAVIRKEGNRLTIEVRQKSKRTLLDVLRGLEPIEERLPDITRPPAEPFDL